jgi:dipeptidyl aminopeptidase/acylaminoacyl peptidase
MKRYGLLALLAGGLTGCVPVDLDVSSKGEMIIPREEGFFLYHPGKGQITQLQGAPPGQPVAGRFTPSGAEVLLVVKTRDEGKFEDVFRCELLPLAGGKGRTLYKASKVGNLQFSPDGAQLAVVRYETEKDSFQEEAQLHLVDVKTGKDRLALKKVGHFVRWFADSKRLLLFRIQSKKNSDYLGEIALFDTAGDKVTPLAGVLTRKESSLDLSPDNRKAILSAYRAGAVGAQLKADGSLRTYLFELDIGGRTVRNLSTEAIYVRYSPSGKKVVLTRRSARDFLGTRLELVVADAGLTDFKPIAADSYAPVFSLGMESECFPGWMDDQRLFYFSERMVFGQSGKALHMVLIGADGSNKKFVQPDIDQGVEKAKAAAKPMDQK